LEEIDIDSLSLSFSSDSNDIDLLSLSEFILGNYFEKPMKISIRKKINLKFKVFQKL
jgi:hypothetical protein